MYFIPSQRDRIKRVDKQLSGSKARAVNFVHLFHLSWFQYVSGYLIYSFPIP